MANININSNSTQNNTTIDDNHDDNNIPGTNKPQAYDNKDIIIIQEPVKGEDGKFKLTFGLSGTNETLPVPPVIVTACSDYELKEIMKLLLTIFVTINANRQLSAAIDLQNFVKAMTGKLEHLKLEAEKRKEAGIISACIAIAGSLVEAGIGAGQMHASSKKAGIYKGKADDLGKNQATGNTSNAEKKAAAAKITADKDGDISAADSTFYFSMAAGKAVDAVVKGLNIFSTMATFDADMNKIKAEMDAAIMNVFEKSETMNTQAMEKIKEIMSAIIQFIVNLVSNTSSTEKAVCA